MTSDYTRAQAIRRPSGHIIVDGSQVADTVQCVHCGAHWVPQIGSGRRRGFCMRCNGLVCGRSDCYACVPAERQLEIREAVIKIDGA